MKNWNAPVMEELNVTMTAQGNVASNVELENGGFYDGTFQQSQYDATEYDRVPCRDGAASYTDKKSSTES